MQNNASFKIAIAAALCGVPLVSAQSTTPLRSYATSGTEHARSYDPATGWTETIQTFGGKFDLLSSTTAQITKIYADGSSVVRDLVLHWTVDLSAPTQGGTAAEIPDPTDPIIKRTTYTIGLQSDGLRDTMLGSYLTRAYLDITGRYDWWNVAYGDFTGVVVSPLGAYNVTGSEKAGKTTSKYTGTFTLLSPTSAKLTRNYTSGASSTVNIALEPAVDLTAASQTVSGAQIENAANQSTTYNITLQLDGTSYAVSSSYSTVQAKGKTVREVANGIFLGNQP